MDGRHRRGGPRARGKSQTITSLWWSAAGPVAALGRMSDAVDCLRRSLEIVPESEIHSSLLFDINYLPETTPEVLYDEACRWNALYAAPLASEIQPHTNLPDPERRLKMGYVSPDLYAHPIAKFVMPVFERHDRSRFEVFIYSVGSKSDDITDWMRTQVEHFVTLPADPQKLAERVRADGIDILVDLAGHTTGEAYLAFARKPAPIQVSWLGVLSTTGMSTMDYFLGDAEMPCPGTEHLFSERVYRLPRAFCCYRPGTEAVVSPARFWSAATSPSDASTAPQDHSRSRQAVVRHPASGHGQPPALKYHFLEEEARQAPLRAWFAEDGIPAERILFSGASSPPSILKSTAESISRWIRFRTTAAAPLWTRCGWACRW